ncbi:MAG: hypothetical protein WA154_05560 [Moraxellaceae bacterium]
MISDDDFNKAIYLSHFIPKKIEGLVASYLKKHCHDSAEMPYLLENDIKSINQCVLVYMMMATHQDLIASQRPPSERDNAKLKKDLTEIQKTADRLLILLNRTEAGRAVIINSKTEKNKLAFQNHQTILSGISAVADNKLSELKPVGRGRLASPEREWRVGLVHKIMQLAKSVDAPHGTGCTGVFHDLILDIYEVLKLKTSNIGRDLRDARQLQLDTAKPDLN